MKTKSPLFRIVQILCAATAAVASTPLQAATNAPAAQIVQSNSSIFQGVQVYSIRFPGGTVSGFFKFMRTNGFADDTILFAGWSGEVGLPEFTVSNVQLKEVAKSIEFVSEGRITVELVEAPEAGDVNVWRIKPADRTASRQLKTRACAVPHLLSTAKGRGPVLEIVEQVTSLLARGTETLYQDHSLRPDGDVSILESEKIVVAVGTEAYVEAIANALAAAESVAATPTAEKKQAQ